MLFGNFIELLDDLVPGMWAEMLNDRGFEGVVPPANWVYYDGSPTFCDRRWDKGPDWALGTNEAFNGPRCARITGHSNRPAGLTQSGLAVTDGKTYRFTGYLRGSGSVRVRVVLKSPLPDGRFDELASADLAAPTESWSKTSAELRANGTSDTTVFELRVDGRGSVWADKLSLIPADNVADGARMSSTRSGTRTRHSFAGAAARSIRAVIAGKTASAIRTSESLCQHKLGPHRLQRRRHRRILPILRARRSRAARVREFFRRSPKRGRSRAVLQRRDRHRLGARRVPTGIRPRTG